MRRDMSRYRLKMGPAYTLVFATHMPAVPAVGLAEIGKVRVPSVDVVLLAVLDPY